MSRNINTNYYPQIINDSLEENTLLLNPSNIKIIDNRTDEYITLDIKGIHYNGVDKSWIDILNKTGTTGTFEYNGQQDLLVKVVVMYPSQHLLH